MDARKLGYFVAIVDQGSLSGASSRLGISQVALSKVVRSLENDLQVRLVDRSSRGITPTVFGKSLYEHAKTIGSALDHARAEIDQMRDRAHNHISIGALPDLANNIVPKAMALFCRAHTDVRINVCEFVTPDLLTGLRKHDFEIVIGLLTTLDNEAGLRRQGLFDDSLSIIAGSRHPLAARRTLTVKDLTHFPWVFLNYGGSFRPRLQQLFRQAGCELPSPQIECASIAFAKSVVREGHHLGALPLHALREEVEGNIIRPLPIMSPILNRKVVAIHLENRPISSVTRSFIAEIRRVGREAASSTASALQRGASKSL